MTWIKAFYRYEDLDRDTGEVLPDAVPPGIYCADEAGLEAFMRERTVDRAHDGSPTYQGLPLLVAGPVDARALRAAGRTIPPMNRTAASANPMTKAEAVAPIEDPAVARMREWRERRIARAHCAIMHRDLGDGWHVELVDPRDWPPNGARWHVLLFLDRELATSGFAEGAFWDALTRGRELAAEVVEEWDRMPGDRDLPHWASIAMEARRSYRERPAA